jgi:hypothetical protein
MNVAVHYFTAYATAKSIRRRTRATANSEQPQSNQKATKSNQKASSTWPNIPHRIPHNIPLTHSTNYATAKSIRRSKKTNNAKATRKQPESNQ